MSSNSSRRWRGPRNARWSGISFEMPQACWLCAAADIAMPMWPFDELHLSFKANLLPYLSWSSRKCMKFWRFFFTIIPNSSLFCTAGSKTHHSITEWFQSLEIKEGALIENTSFLWAAGNRCEITQKQITLLEHAK